jgi:hypothetical protein
MIEIEHKVPKKFMDRLLHKYRILRNIHRENWARYAQESSKELPVLNLSAAEVIYQRILRTGWPALQGIPCATWQGFCIPNPTFRAIPTDTTITITNLNEP